MATRTNAHAHEHDDFTPEERAEMRAADLEIDDEERASESRVDEDADQTAIFLADPMLAPAVREALAGADVRWRRPDEAPRATGASRESTEADARRIYIGKTIPPITAAALEVIPSAEKLWCALAELEVRGQPLPTASLDEHRIPDHETTLLVLEGLRSRYGASALALEQPSGATIRFRVLGAALDAISQLVTHELAVWRCESDVRSAVRDDFADAATSARGARGPAAEPARRARFLEGVADLRASGWERPRLAELVVESRRWDAPPCRTYVDDLLAGADSRDEATKTLIERLRVTQRRSKL